MNRYWNRLKTDARGRASWRCIAGRGDFLLAGQLLLSLRGLLFALLHLVLRLQHLLLHFLKMLGCQFLLVAPAATRLLDREEHGTQLGQPIAIDSGGTLHVLLGGHNQLVVDHIVGRCAETVERRRWMQVAGHARAQIYVFADSLQSCCLIEIRRADALAHNVPIGAARLHVHLLLRHDVLELLPYLAHLAHCLDVNEVFIAPGGAIAVGYIEHKYIYVYKGLYNGYSTTYLFCFHCRYTLR